MGTAIKHLVPDWVKPSFVIFDFWALWHLDFHDVTWFRKKPD